MKSIIIHLSLLSAIAGPHLLPCSAMMARAENNQITIDGLYKKNIVSSPEMSDMQYNCVNSIDYSSGQPDIRIPLFEIECGTLKLPIYLSYKSSGVKISEPSGWVGQNWTLHAEPAISRMPKGHLDLDFRCDSTTVNTILKAEQCTSSNFFSGIDAMPDEYYYSLPSTSGMFMYSKGHISEDSMYICIPYEDVKVVKDVQNVFRITDSDGTRYSFGGGVETNQIDYNYISAWHASSIVAANGIDSISFSYENSFHYEIKRHLDNYTVVDQMMDEYGGWRFGYPFDQMPVDIAETYPDVEPYLRTPIVYETFDKATKSYYVNEFHNLCWEYTRIINDVALFPNIIIQGNRLSSINFNGNNVTFTDELYDNDLNKKRIKKITIKNCNNQIIKVIDFSYYEGYGNTDRYYLSEVAISNNSDTARYSFDYESRFDTDFRFVPNCASRELDLWGYWTNVTRSPNETLVPSMKLYTSIPQTQYSYNYTTDSLTIGTRSIGTVEKSRASNEVYMRIGTLKSITYPTGLKDIFTFEANRARIANGISYDENSRFDIRNHLLCSNDSIFQIGGLRIKEILTVDGSDTIQRRSFRYGLNEDGTGITPILGNVNYYLNVATKRYFRIGTLGWEYACSSRYRTLSSEPVIPLTYSNGLPVKYTYVTEYNGTPEDNTGKTVYIYNLPQYLPNNSSACILFQTRIEDPTLNRYGIMQSDHLIQKISYKREASGSGYTEMERDTYNYDVQQKPTGSISGCEVKFETCGSYPSGFRYSEGQPYSQTFHANSYSCTPLTYLLTAVEHRVTHENGTGTTITTYQYNNVHDKQLTSKTISRSGQPCVTENYLHPQQMGGVSPYAEMVSRNILSPVVRTTYTRNGRNIVRENIYSSHTNFNGGQMFLPTRLKLKTDRMSEGETRCQYQYNKFGRLRMATKDDDENETYIYGYNSQYPIAEVQNATWYDVTMIINPNSMEQIEASSDLTSVQVTMLRNALTGLYAQTGGAALANLYQFKPLVGLTSYTSPGNRIFAYTYDGLSRLKTESISRGNTTEQVRSYTYRFQPRPRITTRTYLKNDGSDWMESFTYLDGRGREKEIVRPWALPDGSSLASFCEYDRFGRLTKEWNPVSFSGSDSSYIDFETFRTTSLQMYDDSRPYSQSIYEASPLDRVVQKYGPGNAWQSNGKCTRYNYLYNSTITDSLKCLKFVVSQDSVKKMGFYEASSLDVEVTSDEDGHTRLDFKDMLGNPVLSRSITDGSCSDTYYIRDEWGNLQVVLPPMLADTLAKSPYTMWKWTNTLIKNYAYLYEYDERYRITSKKLPGCDPIFYTYDTADRLVTMQDGELRNNGRRRFYLYDPLGRLCIQGTTTQSVGEDIIRVARTTGTSGFLNTGYGPTLASMPLPSASSCELELVNYYDDNQYTFLDHYTQISANIRDSLNLSTPQNERGLLVGTWQKTSNGEMLFSTSCYNEYGRLSGKATLGLNGDLSITDYENSFTGDLLRSRTSIYRIGQGNNLELTSTEKIEKKYDFPHNNMLHQNVISIKGAFNTAWMTDTLTYSYDEVGNLISIDRGGTAADMTYSYDLLHGWVKEIASTGGFQQKLYREDNTGHPLYNGSISAMTWQVPGQNYLRRYDYTYDGMNRLTEGKFSQLPVLNPFLLQGAGEELVGEMTGEETMPLGLIPVNDEQGNPVFPNINADDRYTERVKYDKNSNINSIERYGMNNLHQYGKIDSLVISRNGNQLKTIEDYAEKTLTYTGASDFYDGCTYNNEYSYNANGALDMDLNRDIDMIEYDRLGNLRNIWFYDHSSIEYIYATDGTKLRTIHRPAGLSTLTDSIDYIGNLILKNDQPSMYLFDGGYATFNTNGAVNGWHYYIQDYMGNNRMVVNKNGTVEQVTHYYPYGGVIGDISTNENVQKFKFEGKELDRTFGLDNYDIHARQYFAMAPMWDKPDSKAEDYYPISPYAYCGGDPVNYGDFNGKEVVLFATSLPSDIYIPLATHTFVAVFDNNKRCIGYYAYGGTEPVSGQLRQLSYSQDKEVISSYEKGEKNDFVKGEPFVINPPNGMSEEEFDNAVIETSETFGNVPGIQYSLYPGDDDTLGNCNTSSTTLLLKAGASKEQIDIIESQMPGLHWGFGTEKPWTFEEQNKAIKEAQKELNKKLQYLDVNRGH